MYLPRLLQTTFQRACSAFPVVLVTGPRQSGKTTLLQHEAPKGAGYVSFDDPLERAFAREDPNGLLDRHRGGPAILDEIQQVPELLPYIKLRVDRDRGRSGAFLLSGSQQFPLMQGVTESLAGRVAVLDLLPLSALELGSPPLDLSALLWRGGYPDPVLRPDVRDLWVGSYIRTYLERDVRQIREILDLRSFEVFLGLSAAHHAQELNAASLSREVGVSQPTIRSWVSLLCASFVAALLPPWHRNLGKRLVKSPKLYFLDSALVTGLTRQPSGEAALAGPLGGPLFEGWVVSEALKLFAAAGLPPACWFWRSQDGLEVDLLVEVAGQIVPVEVKLTATPTARHVDPLQRFRALLPPEQTHPGLLICRVDEERPLPHGVTALPWRQWPAWLAARLGL